MICFVCENILLNLQGKPCEDRQHSLENTKVNFVFHSFTLPLQRKTLRRQAALIKGMFCLVGVFSRSGMKKVGFLLVMIAVALVLVSCRAAEYCNCG